MQQRQNTISDLQIDNKTPLETQKINYEQSNLFPFQTKEENQTKVLLEKNTSASSNNTTNHRVMFDPEEYYTIHQLENKKPDIFKLDDLSVDPSPPAQLSIQISDISDEQLFTPKIKFSQTEVDSQEMENFNLQFRPTKSFFELPTHVNQNLEIQNLQSSQKQKIRRQKVLRYLKKKMNRSFKKRVSYHSRKTVAESRLRIKGRFITKFQAQQILGSDISRMCNRQIKLMLQRHYSG